MFLVFSMAEIFVFLLIFIFLFLIIGKVLKSKKKKGSTFFKALSVICTIAFAVIALYIFIPRSVEIKTPQGTKKVMTSDIDDVRGLVEESLETGEIDVKAVKKIVTEKPELIYYTDYYYVSDEDYPTLLEWAVFYNEFELADFFMENGAEFDSDIIYEDFVVNSSLESYFDALISMKNKKEYDASTEVINYMAEKDADFKNILLSESVYEYIFRDDKVSDDEVEIIKALIENDASIDVKKGHHKPYDVFMKVCGEYEENEDNGNFDDILKMLEE